MPCSQCRGRQAAAVPRRWLHRPPAPRRIRRARPARSAGRSMRCAGKSRASGSRCPRLQAAATSCSCSRRAPSGSPGTRSCRCRAPSSPRTSRPADWAAVEDVLAAADHVRTISEYGDRKDGYLDCGIETVNGADLLLAVWDGEPARGRGGTADVVRVRRVDRQAGDDHRCGDPRGAQGELGPRSMSDDAVLADLNGLPDATTCWSENPFQAPDAVFLFQQKCDFHANHGAPQFRRLIVVHRPGARAGHDDRGGEPWPTDCTCLRWPGSNCSAWAPACGARWCCDAQMHSDRSWVSAGSPRNSAARRLPPGDCRAPPPCCRTSTSPVRARLARSLCILHGAVSPRRARCRSRNSSASTSRSASTTSSRTTTPGEAARCRCYRRLRQVFSIATVAAMVCMAILRAHPARCRWMCRTGCRRRCSTSCRSALPVAAAATISIISINDLQRRVARYRDMKARSRPAARRLPIAAPGTASSAWCCGPSARCCRKSSSGTRSAASASRTERHAMNTAYKYRAFISYSHSDERWASLAAQGPRDLSRCRSAWWERSHRIRARCLRGSARSSATATNWRPPPTWARR